MQALVLGGGAARGAYEAGVAHALCERETFDIVCGTSIGAVNGMLVAQDAASRLYDIWSTMAQRNVTKLRPELGALQRLGTHVAGLRSGSLAARARHLAGAFRALPRLRALGGMVNARGLFDTGNIRSAVSGSAAFADLRRIFIANVTNLSTGTAEAFAYFPPGHAAAAAAFYASEPDARPFTPANYADAVRASAALPPGFEPVDIACEDGVTRTFSDGALTNNTPIRQAIDAGATGITLVMLSHPGLREKDYIVRSLPHIFAITLDASAERMLDLDLKLVRRINEDVHRGFDPVKRFIDVRVIAPSVPLHLRGMDFDKQEAIDRVYAQGRADGAAAVR